MNLIGGHLLGGCIHYEGHLLDGCIHHEGHLLGGCILGGAFIRNMDLLWGTFISWPADTFPKRIIWTHVKSIHNAKQEGINMVNLASLHYIIHEAMKRYIKPHYIHIGSDFTYFYLDYVFNVSWGAFIRWIHLLEVIIIILTCNLFFCELICLKITKNQIINKHPNIIHHW